MAEDDRAEILRLDNAWNEAYLRRNRAPLADILADDFSGLTPSGGGDHKSAADGWRSGDRRSEISFFQ
jgi:hypothetical protein